MCALAARRAASRARRPRPRRPGAWSATTASGRCFRRGTRPAEPQPRLELAQDDQRAHPHRRDERALDQAVLAQRLDHALLVAGELEVDVELDAVERRARRGGRGPRRASARRRRARSRGRAAGGPCRARAGARAGRRTRSCRRRGRAPRRRTRACCRGRSGPRPCVRCASALTSWTPVCRPVVVALPACADLGRAAARARLAGGAVDDLEAVLHAVARRTPASAGGSRGRSRSASSSETSPVRRQGSIAASKQPSTFHRLPIPAMIRWSISASPIGRVGSSSRSRRRNACSSSSGARMSGPRPAMPLVEAGALVGHQLEHRAVDLGDERSPRRIISHVLRGRAASRASRTRHLPVMRRCEWIASPFSKRRNRCLPCASTLVHGLALPGARASGRGRSAGAASRSRPALGPPAPAGSGSPRSGWCRPRARFRVWSAPRRCLPEPAPTEVRLQGFPGENAVTRAAHRVRAPAAPCARRARTTRAVGRRRRTPVSCARRERCAGVLAAALPRRASGSRARWPCGRGARSGRGSGCAASPDGARRPTAARRWTARASSPRTSRS